MLVVGLTGGIGCGKSLVSNLFNKLYAIPIIDADAITRELTQTSSVIDQISQQLGPEFLDANKQLLRKKLRQAIFSDPSIRTKLENILHPLVYDYIRKELSELDASYCIVVIPLLLETKPTNFINRILVVNCTIEQQISRVMQRDQCSQSHVENIIDTQTDRDSRISLADDIIENNASTETVKDNVALLHKKYIELSKLLNK